MIGTEPSEVRICEPSDEPEKAIQGIVYKVDLSITFRTFKIMCSEHNAFLPITR